MGFDPDFASLLRLVANVHEPALISIAQNLRSRDGRASTNCAAGILV
jgi:hypothetical protein